MSQRTSIEWTDVSWNPTRGCSRVSEGCRNCYAERQAVRQSAPGRAYHGLVKSTKAGPRWTGEVALVYENLEDPLSWQKPQRVFVDSMSDLFHEKVPDEFIALVFAVMAAAQRHTFQILTKRPERMRTLLSSEAFWSDVTLHGMERFWGARELAMLDVGVASPLPNGYFGTSIEDQAAADERIPHLVETPAAVRFLSCEPLLGPLNVERWLTPTMRVSQGVPPDQRKPLSEETVRYLNLLGRAAGKMHGMAFVDWVICGGESGPRARPMDIEWALDLRAQCGFAGVPFFMKQLGGIRDKRGDPSGWPELLRVREMPGEVLA